MLNKIKKHKKISIFVCLILSVILWLNFGRRTLWQIFFAQKSNVIVSDLPMTLDINPLGDLPKQIVQFGDYSVELTFRASAQMTGRVVYVDIYDHSFSVGFKSPNMRMKDVYNTISPLDISIISGQTAVDGNWQKFTITHEYRAVFWQYNYKDHPVFNNGDINNLHVIPASNAVRRGIDTLKTGEIIKLSGWLVDWRELGEFADYPYQTAKEIGQIADFKLGGNISGLCYFFYITELAVDGYVYK